ncbi:hypothetical protein ACFQZS_05640 [Mucilaginibacter calamicampi]|uniref:SH3 domain-containing protein n=1 Tax=Mucilaginibacter calamicampi TaxID=1302352 RepID=A0ABW2YUA7_9SPHI
MKISIILTAILCISISVNAQTYAIIKDGDGYTNVRKGGNTKSDIIGKISNDAIFSFDYEQLAGAKKPEWVEIYQMSEKGGSINGYIHKNRILPLSSLKHIAAKIQGNNSAVIQNDSITIKVTSAGFIAKNHKLTLYHKSPYYEKIDGKKIWGVDGGLPKKTISVLSVIINGSSLYIPKAALSNLFEPNFNTLTVYFGIDNKLYIQMNNSDGAGGYTVIWVIKDGKYQRRYVDNSFA